jgi:hypothetical protein
MTRPADNFSQQLPIEVSSLEIWKHYSSSSSSEKQNLIRERLWNLYKTILRNAKQNPEFSLKKTLSIFRHLTIIDPSLNSQIESDYNQLLSIGIDNPFHCNPEINQTIVK